ncbi:MAG: CcmD family protein [Vicinamibacterales bacterium]
MMRYLRVTCGLLLVVALSAPLAAAQPQPPTDEFVPISEVPPEEQIPAITLVATAYGFVWVAVFAYVWSLGRRLQAAEREIARLEGKKD